MLSTCKTRNEMFPTSFFPSEVCQALLWKSNKFCSWLDTIIIAKCHRWLLPTHLVKQKQLLCCRKNEVYK